MKIFHSLFLGSVAALLMSSCAYHTTRVVEEPAPTVTRTITVLPTGYSTRTYRGVDYYYTKDTYYRRAPAGTGYVVVTRPWVD